MLHSILLRTVTAAGLLPVFVGCAALQEGAPLEQPLPAEESVDVLLPAEESLDALLPEEEPVEATIEFIEDRDETREDDGHESRLGFMLGFRSWNDALFDEVDSGVTAGIDYARTNASGLGWEVGALGNIGTNNGNVTGAAAEIYGGVRKSFDLDRWRPYVGAGATLMYAGADDPNGNQVSDNLDLTPGLYLRGGVNYDIDESMYIGIDVRAVGATSVDFETADGDADYIQGMFVIGLRL